jgi:hypothetical protein
MQSTLSLGQALPKTCKGAIESAYSSTDFAKITHGLHLPDPYDFRVIGNSGLLLLGVAPAFGYWLSLSILKR